MAKKVTRLNFLADLDGFAFNNTWTYEQSEKDAIYSIFDGVVVAAVFGLIPLIPPDPITIAVAIGILKSKIDVQLKQPFGLCGGMAYAALDYYKAKLIIERGFADSHPDHTTSEGGKLRDYIWKRLMDSMTSGGAAATTLGWMCLLHIFHRPDILFNKTKFEWERLKQYIDSGTPWPICLIGNTTSPMNNHQVLAHGYEDNGDGTGTLFIYDNNNPDKECTIKLNFNTSAKDWVESHKSDKRGPLQGFFCTSYQFNPPPAAVGLLKNVVITPASPQPGQTVSISYTATNVGFGPTPPMRLYVRAAQKITGSTAQILTTDKVSEAVSSSDALPSNEEADLFVLPDLDKMSLDQASPDQASLIRVC
jgi:hypothetical protein